jgi:hypothetical protein
MPNESGALTMALMLTMWCVALLGFPGTLLWMRSRPGAQARPARVPVRPGRR